MHRVLDGIRVLDFGRYIAGPFCATLLGDLGAEVIRIEKVDGSEDRYVTPIGDGGDGALFMQIGRNKKSVTLNPMKPEGREIVKKLVATADVVIANLPPQTLQAMGLDYESLKAIKPDIILTTVSAYGPGGPYSNRVGFDGIGQVMSSAAYMSGTPEEPRRAAVPWVDYGTALSCAWGTMAALMARMQTGQGQEVQGALLRTALMMANGTLIEQDVIGADRVPKGNLGQTSAPNDLYRTKDGWIITSVVGQPLYERWARLMGENNWLTDERFKDDISRGDHGEIISERMQKWCEERTTEEAVSTLGDNMIPAAPVYTPQQALEDPHINAAGFFNHLAYPGLPKEAPVVGPPVTLSGTPGEVRERAPTLGEHTDEIIGALGYGASDLARFREMRVI